MCKPGTDIQIGEFNIRPSEFDKGSIWIENGQGEGMETPQNRFKDFLEEAIKLYFEDNH